MNCTMKRSLGTVKPLEDCPRSECRYWEIRVSCGYNAITGKRVRPYERFGGTESEAYLRLMQIRIEHGLVDSTDMTVAEYFVGVYLPYAKGKVRLKTYETYKSAVDNYIVPLFGAYSLEGLPPYFVEAQLGSIEKPGARLNVYKALRQGYRKAASQKMIKFVITDAIDEPKIKRKSQPTVGSDHMWDYIKAFEELGEEERGLYLAVVVGFGVAMRRSEILAIDCEEIDWSYDAQGYLGGFEIHRSFHKRHGVCYFEDTKNEEHDLILFPRWCGEILREHAKDRTGPLITHKGERMYPDYLTKKWSAVVKDKKLPINMPFKNTRHSVGTMLVREDGIPLADVQQLLRHTTIKTTEMYYVQKGTASVERTAAAMSKRSRPKDEDALLDSLPVNILQWEDLAGDQTGPLSKQQ